MPETFPESHTAVPEVAWAELVATRISYADWLSSWRASWVTHDSHGFEVGTSSGLAISLTRNCVGASRPAAADAPVAARPTVVPPARMTTIPVMRAIRNLLGVMGTCVG